MQVHRMEDYRISHRVGRSNGTGQLKVKQKRRKPYLRRRKMKARPERKSMM